MSAPTQLASPTCAPSTADAMPAGWRFGEIDLTEPITRAVWEAGYRSPTPIQARCVPILL
ncbi:MAG: DNA helicase, partial [Proteobacteria bacterium]|nr:DNA helicase [Pseudomonadota bacterium]